MNVNIGVFLWTSLRSRFSRESNSPELECGQGFSGKNTTALRGNTLPNAEGNVPQAVTDAMSGWL